MKWDIFSNRKKERRHHRKDEIDEMIDIIEKFAPRKYRSERDAFYYNYKIMPPYLKPLFSLLQVISQRERLNEDQVVFARELFLKLKGFYDPKEKLSLVEAIEDGNLIRKFRELFLFFYDKKDFSAQEIEGWLRDI
ncbi:MAG: hypothetical protein IMF11_11690 [Proteobacteria bacterium]|nr:hypothetical protein [Pseudomonadota bacterium]